MLYRFALLAFLFSLPTVTALEPISDKLVVLTFDDAVKSHHSVVRPILKKYGFGATFFVTEGFGFPTNKTDYMTWEEIAELHADGFEIGNHTRDHFGVKPGNVDKLAEQVRAIADRCLEHKIPAPVSFAWPGNAFDPAALAVLKENGILLARRGGSPEYPYKEGRGVAYEPGLDHPLLIPSAGDARPDWTIDNFIAAVEQARRGRIAVLQFHGVPDHAHPWVHTSPEKFEAYMKYLSQHGYHVIAMRDLTKYVDPTVAPSDPLGVVKDRKNVMAAGRSPDDFRRPVNDDDLAYWLENMAVFHRYVPAEIGAATGLSSDEVAAALERLGLQGMSPPARRSDDPLLVRPYPVAATLESAFSTAPSGRDESRRSASSLRGRTGAMWSSTCPRRSGRGRETRASSSTWPTLTSPQSGTSRESSWNDSNGPASPPVFSRCTGSYRTASPSAPGSRQPRTKSAWSCGSPTARIHPSRAWWCRTA